MRAYKVHRLYVCQISGEVLAEISFQLTGELVAEIKPFSNQENALAHIYRARRTWLLTALEVYIFHKRHIIQSNNDTTKIQSLDICLQALAKYQDMGLKKICEGILKGRNHFLNILPVLTNQSYAGSSTNLKEIFSFCEEVIKQP